jgi:small membrane protein
MRFQVIALVVLGCALVAEGIALWRSRAHRGVWGWMRIAVWSAAAVGIALPNSVTWLAQGVGIQRGADLVLYVSCLAFISFGFFLYARCLSIERKLTILIRHQAIRGALRGGERPAEDPELR